MTKPAANLFDEVYRASFFKQGDPRNIIFVNREEVLRRHMRDARRFMLDDAMSSFLVDLSSAAFMQYTRRDLKGSKIVNRLVDQLRMQSRLPHALTWVEFNFTAASKRAHELGFLPDPSELENQRTLRQGWLLNQHPTNETHFRCHVFEHMHEIDRLITVPFSFTWVTDDDPTNWKKPGLPDGYTSLSEMCSGVVGYRNDRCSIGHPEYLEGGIDSWTDEAHRNLISDFMHTHSATLRRVWAFLATINDIPVRINSIVPAKGFMARGNYYRFLEHKTIHLDVLNKTDVRKLARDVVAIARRRAHQVRGHWRNDWRYPLALLCEHEFDAHMTCKYCHGRQLWVHEHQRGDASMGFVTHDYEVHAQ